MSNQVPTEKEANPEYLNIKVLTKKEVSSEYLNLEEFNELLEELRKGQTVEDLSTDSIVIDATYPKLIIEMILRVIRFKELNIAEYLWDIILSALSTDLELYLSDTPYYEELCDLIESIRN